MHKTILALSIFCALGTQQAVAAQPTLEEKLDILQQEIEALKAQIAQTQAAAVPKGPSVSLASEAPGYNPSASGGAAFNYGQANTVIGGYGEVNYNNYRDRSVADKADLRRFVLFFGHKFNDQLHFQSELEVEHGIASKEDNGELEVEQAYLDYRMSDAVNFKAGLYLIPLGILNETHEPPTFYGVERNEVESRIIPSTWREGGIGLFGEVLPGLSYDAGITTGFDSGKLDDPTMGIRSAHQELSQANANDLSLYGALNYRGIPGLLLGGGVFSGDTGQNGATKPALEGVNARLTLWDLHAKYSVGDMDLQALYARGSLGDADKVSAATGVVAPKSLYGWYGQAAYHVWKKGDLDLAPFVRYERYNTQASVADGYVADPLNNETVTTVGVNFRLHPQVVLKADIQNYKTDNKKDRFNLGVGYMF